MAAPTSIDIHIGKQLRSIRTRLGLTQESIGAIIDVSFQQVQKYERGSNSIGADNLYFLAQGLNVPVGFFFEGLEDFPTETEYLAKIEYSVQDKELLHYFHKIPNKSFRDALIALVGAIAEDEAIIELDESYENELQPIVGG